MENIYGKLPALVLIFGGALGVILVYKIFKSCIHRSISRGRRFLEFPGIICILLYAIPMAYLTFQDEHLLSFTLSRSQFILLLLGCFTAATLINLLRWGFRFGIGFSLCHLFLAGLLALLAILAIIAIFLIFAVLAPSSSRQNGFWIGKNPAGEEFLVFFIGDDWYQDEEMNTYQRIGNDTMSGPDGSLYYIHRSA